MGAIALAGAGRADAITKLASLEKRRGPRRPEAIFEAWSNAEGLNNGGNVSPETLASLRSSVLSLQNDLPPEMQHALAFSGWQTLPHEQLLPLVRKLGRESLGGTQVRYDTLQKWCEAAPDECSAAIIDLYLEAPPRPYNAVILLMPESEHAELDAVLAGQLRGVAAHTGTLESNSVAAMLLRTGSRKLVPAVNAVLAQARLKRKTRLAKQTPARQGLICLAAFFASLRSRRQSVSIRNYSRQRIDAAPDYCDHCTIIVIPTTNFPEHSER